MRVYVCDTLLMAFPMPRLPRNNPTKEIAPEMMEAQHTPHTCSRSYELVLQFFSPYFFAFVGLKKGPETIHL